MPCSLNQEAEPLSGKSESGKSESGNSESELESGAARVGMVRPRLGC
ncbi:MAG: hypothetical protein R6W92_00955 [Desulfocurvibacter africanus]